MAGDSDARASQRTPDEPRALVAVDRSARAYVRAFPYLQWRYGPDIETTVHRDNAHFIALAEHDADELERQVRWTADMLSERGTPRWMLEVDLRLMARVAKRELPQRRDIAEHLYRAADELAGLRRRVMSEIGFRRCAAVFADRLNFTGPRRLWVGFGFILASAVADEQGGLAHAVTRVHEWCADQRRFGQPWLDAVDHTIAHARRL
jgi:hypothetical protein